MPTDFLAGLITMAIVRKTLVTTRKIKKKKKTKKRRK